MLGTSEGSFYLLSKLWKKSPQTGFSGHGHEHFFVQSRAEDNLAELRKRGYHWIPVKRGGVKPDQVDGVNARDPDATINTSSGHEVRVWRLSHTNGLIIRTLFYFYK